MEVKMTTRSFAMRLHHLEFAGGLKEAVGFLNENGLVPFDVVATRVVANKDSRRVEVALLVPVGFDEARWRLDAPETVDYQMDMYVLAARHRAGGIS